MPPVPVSAEVAAGPGATVAELAQGDGFVPAVFSELAGIGPPSEAATATATLAEELASGALLDGLGVAAAALGISQASGLGELVAGADVTPDVTRGANPYPLGTELHALWQEGFASGDPRGAGRPAADRQAELVAYLRGVYAHRVLAALTAPPSVPPLAAPGVTPGAFGGLLVGVLPFAGALVVTGLIYALRALVALVGGIVSTAARPVPFVGDWTAQATRDATHFSAGVLGQAASALDPLAAAFWQDGAKLASWLWQEVSGGAALTHAHAHAIGALAAGQHARRPSPWAQGRAQALAAGQATAGAARVGPLAARLGAVADRLHGADARINAGRSPQVEAQLGALHARTERLQAQLDAEAAHRAQLEKLVTAGAGAGLFMGAARRIGAGWLQCRNWRNIGRSMCGVPGNLLNDLLALALDFLVLENICTVLPWLEDAASTVGVPLVEGLAAVIDAGTCGGAARGPALKVPRLYYPPAEPLALHLPA